MVHHRIFSNFAFVWLCVVASSAQVISHNSWAEELETEAPPTLATPAPPRFQPATPQTKPEPEPILKPTEPPVQQTAPNSSEPFDEVAPSTPVVTEAPTPTESQPETYNDIKARGYRTKETTKFIEHPQAEKGLIKIEKTGAYRYKVNSSPISSSFSFRVGTFDPTKLENPDLDPVVGFADIYDPASGPILFGDYEFRFLKSLGKMGFKLGGGLFATSGKGIFEDTQTPALESFTFIALPFTASLIYRLQFWEGQPIVPYGEGGLMGIGFMELRDDGVPPKFGGSSGFFVAGGAQVDMGLFGSEEILDLDNEYGINRLWFLLEFRAQYSFSKYDFSGNVINGGFLFEY